jgi:hypothetical protein
MTFLPPPAGLYYVQVRLTPTAGGHESATVKAIVDLGSPVSIANWVRPRPDSTGVPVSGPNALRARGAGVTARGGHAGQCAAESVGVSPGSALLRDTGEVVAGASVGGQGVATSRVVQLDAALRAGGAAGEGAVPLGTHRVEIADLPVFASLGLARTPAMVLGTDVPARLAPAPRRAPRAASGARPPLRAGAGPEAGRVGRSCLARAGAARPAERWPSASRAASCGCDSATQRDGARWRQRLRGAEAARGRGSSSAGTALHLGQNTLRAPRPTTRRREHARSSTAREGTARARGR